MADGHGGYRVGAGRKRKSPALGALTGSRRTAARAKQAPATNQTANQTASAVQVAAVMPTLDPTLAAKVPAAPGYLTLEELAEWHEIAPLAVQQGTLTAVEIPALVDLCRARVLMVKLLRAAYTDGLTQITEKGALQAHPSIARYTTLQQRVDAGMLRFGLAPAGKVTGKEPEQPADPFDQFDGAGAGDGAVVN